MGYYQFNGSVMSGLLGPGAAVPLASFLLGYPDLTTIANVINPNTDAWANAFGAYIQDDFKLSQRLTINYGLRWEYHPGFQDKDNDMVNFDPYYQNIVNGKNTGAVIVDNADWPWPPTSIRGSQRPLRPTPIILASQAGIGPSNREASHKDFAPRVGFAWRVFNNNKTVLRGGYGRFIESLLSGSAIDGWSVGASDVGNFANSIGAAGVPAFKLPYSWPTNIAQPGSPVLRFGRGGAFQGSHRRGMGSYAGAGFGQGRWAARFLRWKPRLQHSHCGQCGPASREHGGL